jgi:hypothetical protein
MTEKLFANLQALGSGLATGGYFNPEILEVIAKPERFPAILGPIFRLFLRLPISHGYFDGMLKENGVYEQRFAAPHLN